MVNNKQRIISTLTLLILDFLWIGLYMGSQYSVLVKNIQGSNMKTNIIYGFFAYFLMVIGLNNFVLPKLDTKNINFKSCLSSGFLFGIIVYGVYDFTCAAVLKDWDIKLALIDILWGGIVYFMACLSVMLIK